MASASAPPLPIPYPSPTAPAPPPAARYAWARLFARVDEVLPLLCPFCAAQMQIVAFHTDPTSVRAIPLRHARCRTG
jgi:hypothetical protein